MVGQLAYDLLFGGLVPTPSGPSCPVARRAEIGRFRPGSFRVGPGEKRSFPNFGLSAAPGRGCAKTPYRDSNEQLREASPLEFESSLVHNGVSFDRILRGSWQQLRFYTQPRPKTAVDDARLLEPPSAPMSEAYSQG
jgi:hypothetical protein